ncbi:hypothetical protein N665_0005s0148 [Sinapis alba]|nr:hypothetical protein N665_0005s0148 [Sinapis alba]
MDSLSTQKVKQRKMKAVVKKSRVQILLDLFYRVIEITVVMVTVAKLCYQLVIMFEDSGLTRFLINRHLAFLLGNAIVIAVVAKCGLFSNQEPDARRNSNDFHDEFVRESSRREQSLHTDEIRREKQSSEEDRSKQISEDKKRQSMLENRAKQSTEDNREKQSKDITVKRHKQVITQEQESTRKSYERSGSENLEGSKKKSSCGRLKRSETERPADVSDAELRYKIESFIARQRRNQKDEEFCIV